MIKQIKVKDFATFGADAQILNNLKSVNYFYGANGSGKTTVSRVINDASRFPSCSLTWENNIALDRRVFNREFIDDNFRQEMRGVFTLGEGQIDSLKKIEEANAELVLLQVAIINYANTLDGEVGTTGSGKRGELARLETRYNDTFWVQKTKYYPLLREVFEGSVGSKDRFKEKILSESTNNISQLVTQADLESKYVQVYSETLSLVEAIPSPETNTILSYETTPVLSKKVIGAEDVDIASMIRKLNCVDWVREGKTLHEANNGVCPFCQRETNENFKKSLETYFNDEYINDIKAISELQSNYETEANRLVTIINGILALNSKFVDNGVLARERVILENLIETNKQKLHQKKKEASQVIELTSLTNVLEMIVTCVSEANKKIAENNKIVNNLNAERATLANQAWRFITEEIRTHIEQYQADKNNLYVAITAITKKMTDKMKERDEKVRDIAVLERQVTSIVPTRDAMNRLLSTFGFTGFKLIACSDNKGYQIVREDGTLAVDTLSEGEKSFVVFLYFYHLLKGSQTSSGVTANRIVVIDDPVCSLDNEVAFIVGSLVRELINEARTDTSNIKQVFVFTHNIYFHKDVTRASNRQRQDRLRHETFWIIKKRNGISLVEGHDNNPIKSSYELLWGEIKSEQRSKATIANTMRRIIDNYFKMLGGFTDEDIYKYFEGDEKIICKSLCAWINEGSHSALDEDYHSLLDDEAIARHLDVFKKVFEKTGHEEHYKMMTKE